MINKRFPIEEEESSLATLSTWKSQVPVETLFRRFQENNPLALKQPGLVVYNCFYLLCYEWSPGHKVETGNLYVVSNHSLIFIRYSYLRPTLRASLTLKHKYKHIRKK